MGYELFNEEHLTIPTVNVYSYIHCAAIPPEPACPGFADGQLQITYNVRVTALSMFGMESLPSASVEVVDLAPPLAYVTGFTSTPNGGRPAVPVIPNTPQDDLLYVYFNGPMLYTDIILASNWNFVATGTVTPTVTYYIGGALGMIEWDEDHNLAIVPWALTSSSTGSIGSGRINPTFSGDSISSGLPLATAITATTGF
jgi:hypothetical protein